MGAARVRLPEVEVTGRDHVPVAAVLPNAVAMVEEPAPVTFPGVRPCNGARRWSGS